MIMRVKMVRRLILGFLLLLQHTTCGDEIRFQCNDCLKIFGHHVRLRRSLKSFNGNHRRSLTLSENQQSENAAAKCPPPLEILPEDVCTVEPCQFDSECTLHGQKCCYNGCMNSCVHLVRPPPLIDWETRSGDTTGDSIEDVAEDIYEGNLEFDIIPGEMLVKSHQGGLTGEMCSTTEDDGDFPMECPHGYECHIEDPGHPIDGIPNRGRCIAINENAPEDILLLGEEYSYY